MTMNVKCAEVAPHFQHAAMYPSDCTLYHMVASNGIINCPITDHDLCIATIIKGSSWPGLKDKETEYDSDDKDEDKFATIVETPLVVTSN